MNRAIEYAKWAINSEKVGKFVKLQCEEILRIYEGKENHIYFCEKTYKKINKLLTVIIHPDTRKNMLQSIDDYAYFFIISIFCIKKYDGNIRYYQTAILEIGRKNRKTFYSAIIFILYMLLANEFDRFYSVAPVYKLTEELKKALEKIISVSSALRKHFKIKRDVIVCKVKKTEYIPLTNSKDRLDGKLASAFLCDEACAMDGYPTEAMRSSQITLDEKLGIIISTQYPNDNNGFEVEVDKAKRKLLNESAVDNRIFALLYEPDEDIRQEWKENDLCLYQANPISVVEDKMFENLKQSRAEAIIYPSKKTNFLCKHLNIKYQDLGAEAFVDIEKLKKCSIVDDKDFWKGKRVYIGLDLSMSDDNTSVSMATLDNNGDIYVKSFAFIPALSVDIKSSKENINYEKMLNDGYCYKCGDEIIDYLYVERFILNIEKEYGVKIIQVGYDRYNAIATVNRLEEMGIECVEIKQHSSTLHAPTKLLYEYILQGAFKFFENPLYIINFQNAKCTFDTNMNRYVHKKRSGGKVDMVVSTILAIYLIQQEMLYADEELEVLVF